MALKTSWFLKYFLNEFPFHPAINQLAAPRQSDQFDHEDFVGKNIDVLKF